MKANHLASATRRARAIVLACIAVGVWSSTAQAQKKEQGPSLAAVPAETLAGAVNSGVAFLVTRQEGQGKGEWPYEGVYRVGGEIPIGYRVGNTGICVMALLQAPGYADDPDRQAAVERAVEFICEGTKHPLMSEADYKAGYDVRGWGYIFGMHALLRFKAAGTGSPELGQKVDGAIGWYCDSLQKIEIPQAGGWNYARRGGRDRADAPSTFMTPCALQALFEAKQAGFAVNAEVVERALNFLEKSKGSSGAVQYAGTADRRSDQVPGSVGRMLSVETTLMLAGRGSVSSVRGALDGFITHWDWLNARRAKTGTHEGPYGVAPYYFMFAHRYAAQAIEMLPEGDRAEYRRRVNNLLFGVRAEDGSWNDRVFPRTANYGTAMAMLSVMEPESGRVAKWAVEPAKAE